MRVRKKRDKSEMHWDVLRADFPTPKRHKEERAGCERRAAGSEKGTSELNTLSHVTQRAQTRA